MPITWRWTTDREKLAHLIEAGKVEATGNNGARIRWHYGMPAHRHGSSPVAFGLIKWFEQAGLICRGARGLWSWTDAGVEAYAGLTKESAAA